MPTVAVSPSWRTHSWSLVKRSVAIAFLLGKDLAAVVMSGDKRHRRDFRRARHIADDERKAGAIGSVPGVDIAHRNGAADARAEAAAGDGADSAAGLVRDRSALAGRGAALGAEADALAARPFAE